MSAETSDYDLARAIFGWSDLDLSGGGTQAYVAYGTALSDSAAGRVTVAIDGMAEASGQGVELPTTVDVRDGDRVIITIVNHAPTVTGVVGGGDRTVGEVDKAHEDALAAKQAAEYTQSLVDAIDKAMEEVDRTLAQAKKDLEANRKALEQAQKDLEANRADLAEANKALEQARKDIDAAAATVEQSSKEAANALAKAQESLDKAASADQTAAEAAGIARGKATILIQDAAPDAAHQDANTLWIDTAGGANTPKRWGRLPALTVATLARLTVSEAAGRTVAQLVAATDEMGWVNVTDSAATSAALAAAEAQRTADGKNRISHAMSEPAGPHAQGDQWWVLDYAGSVVGVRVWNGSRWAPHSLVVDSLAVPSSVGSVSIADGAVTAPKIFAGSVSADKLAANSVTAGKIAAGSVSADKLAANSVIADKLAANSVGADKLVANAVTADKLMANSVGTDKLVANSVTADKLAANAVTADKIMSHSVTSDKVDVKSLTAAFVNSGQMTAGDPSKAHVTFDGAGLTAYGTNGKTKTFQVMSGSGRAYAYDGFYVTNSAGGVIAKFASALVEIGANAVTSVLKLCGGKGQISYGTTYGLQLESDNLFMRGALATVVGQSNPSGVTSVFGGERIDIGASAQGDVYVKNHWFTSVYRLYNKNNGAFLFTTDTNERATLIREGWSDQGVAFHAFQA